MCISGVAGTVDYGACTQHQQHCGHAYMCLVCMCVCVYVCLCLPLQTHPDTDRPYEPPRVTSVEVLANPFDDIVPRRQPQRQIQQQEEEAKKAKDKAK